MELRGEARGGRQLSGVEMQFHFSFRSKRLCLFACAEKTIQQCHNNESFQFNSCV